MTQNLENMSKLELPFIHPPGDTGSRPGPGHHTPQLLCPPCQEEGGQAEDGDLSGREVDPDGEGSAHGPGHVVVARPTGEPGARVLLSHRVEGECVDHLSITALLAY